MARKLRFLTALLIEWMKADVLRAQWLCYVSVQSLWVVPKQSGEKKSGLIDTFERYTQSSQASNGIKTLIWAPPITWRLPEVCCFKSSSHYNHLYDIMSMSVACFVALWDYVFQEKPCSLRSHFLEGQMACITSVLAWVMHSFSFYHWAVCTDTDKT